MDKILEQFQTKFAQAHSIVAANGNNWESIHKLPEHELDLLLIGVLDSQVLNGGFKQWVENGYSEDADQLIEALKRLEVPQGARVLHLVTRALRIGEAPSWSDEDGEAAYERWADELDELDGEYYAISDEFALQYATKFCS